MKTIKNSKIIIQVGVKALILNKDGKILLLKCVLRENSGIYWDMPGGRIEGKESLVNNLKREIFEETKLVTVKIGKVLAVQEFLHDNKHIMRLTYVARVTSTKSLRLSNEHSEYKWFDLSEIHKLRNLDKYLKLILKDKIKLSLIESYINKG
ncbi:MAG: NUDIX hydrolase [bacterium]